MKKNTNHSQQEKIIRIVSDHPGIYFRQIQKTLGIPLGTLTRHLHSLEKQKKIISTKHKHFDYKYYWIKEQYNYRHPLIQNRLSHTELKIYNIIKKTPGIIQKQIAIQTQRKQTTIAYHLNKMWKNGTITYRKVGKTKRYYPSIKKQ